MSHAKIQLQRVLYDGAGGGAGELVQGVSAGKGGVLGGTSHPALGSLTLKASGGGKFHNATGGGAHAAALTGTAAPKVGLRLARSKRGRLPFNLNVANIAVPAPPSAYTIVNRRVISLPDRSH